MGEAFRGNFQDFNTSLQLDGMFKGIIEDIADPLRMGRVRVRIYGVHTPKIFQDEFEGIPTEHLPWAEQVAPLMGGSSGAGGFAVPLVGTVVFCFFERGDPMHPRYFGVLMGKTAPQNNDKINPGGNSDGMSATVPSDPANPDSPAVTNPNVVSSAANICQAAEELGVGDDPCKVQAVAMVESGGRSGFNKDNTAMIAYEPHVFKRNVSSSTAASVNDAKICNSYTKRGSTAYSGQADGYARLEKAMQIDKDAAIKACSWGKYQVLGENYKALGYGSVGEFHTAVMDPNRQEEIFTRFVKSKKGLQGALQQGDWATFASGYNGKNYKDGNYDTKIKNAYDNCKKAGGIDCSKKG